jgi:Lrp/AsnC family leucine-responsive transcriptional regulator
LLTLPNVRDSKSYIVMEEAKETLTLPIGDRIGRADGGNAETGS